DREQSRDQAVRALSLHRDRLLDLHLLDVPPRAAAGATAQPGIACREDGCAMGLGREPSRFPPKVRQSNGAPGKPALTSPRAAIAKRPSPVSLQSAGSAPRSVS